MSAASKPCMFDATARGGERGFTLVELMVALSGGLFLSIMVFALARDASRFYQRESRVTSATLAGMVGFERLKGDIERAGYLGTPNIQNDPKVCTRGDAGTPIALKTLAGLRITPNTPDLSGNSAFALNASAGQTLTPDQILLSGSYSATDEFPISEASSGVNIYLQLNSASMARIGYLNPLLNGSDQLKLLQNVFGATAGQILRVKDQTGQLYFGQIATVTAGTQPFVTIVDAFPLRSSGVGVCGTRGFEMGSSANVVNLVRYRVMDLQNDSAGSAWAPLFNVSQGAEGESSRTELVRDQLTTTGATIDGTTDVVAEYAVDLRLSVVGRPTHNVAVVAPVSYDEDQNAFAHFFAANGTGDWPEDVAAVRLRLSVRSREADRTTGIAGGLYRFQVAPSLWARVRTFQADVALPNQARIPW